MHFAVGMCGGAAVTLVPCLILRRGWRHIPVGMTLGGLWGIVPDLPRLWREDFTGLPFAATLGSKDFELWLHSIGDLFFFHRSFDAQPKEFALLGLAMIIGLYNLCILGLLWHKRSQRVLSQSHYSQTPPPVVRPAYESQTQREPSPASEPPAKDDPYTNPVLGRIGADRSA
jgi:hypothetical protein